MSITESTAMPRLGRRRREAHHERIVAGDVTFERNDITAARYGVTERTLNRGDARGAPYQYFGGVKYRPQPAYDAFILSGIRTRKPPSSKRRKTI